MLNNYKVYKKFLIMGIYYFIKYFFKRNAFSLNKNILKYN